MQPATPEMPPSSEPLSLSLSESTPLVGGGGGAGSPTSSSSTTTPAIPRSTKVAVGCVLASEAAERFSYYGIRAILILFLTAPSPVGLGFNEGDGVATFSLFVAGSYLSPLLGAYVADAVLGQYRAIVLFMSIYLFGLLVLAGGAWLVSKGVFFVGLSLVALGTGGVKPTAGAFGCAQLTAGGVSMPTVVTRFWSGWYFAINVGSFMSYLLTPLIRGSCGYGAARLFCACVFAVSFAVFLSGSKLYVHPPLAARSPYDAITKAVCASCCSRRPSLLSTPIPAPELGGVEEEEEEGGAVAEPSVAKPVPPHPPSAWRRFAIRYCRCSYRLDAARGVVPDSELEAAQAVVDIAPLMMTLALFWCVYDAQDSVWTLQRTHTDNCLGDLCVAPEQFAILNSTLTLAFLPLFALLLYPLATKLGLRPSPLRRMTLGMQVAACAVRWGDGGGVGGGKIADTPAHLIFHPLFAVHLHRIPAALIGRLRRRHSQCACASPPVCCYLVRPPCRRVGQLGQLSLSL